MSVYKILRGNELVEDLDMTFRYEQLLEEAPKKKRVIVYRGESYDMVSPLLNVKFNGGHLIELYEKIFMLGVKAKFYGTSEEIEKLIFTNSESVTKTTFVDTLDALKNCFRRPDRFTPVQQKAIQDFLYNNSKFVEFIETTNSEDFYDSSIAHKSLNFKTTYRDYLFYFLHTISAPEYKCRSVLISTTMKEFKARDFATQRGLIYTYLLPEPRKDYAVRHGGHNEILEFAKKYQVPMPTVSFFPSQEEYSIKRALFPNQIISIYDINQDTYLLNPQFNHQTVVSILENGFQINQDNFEDVFRRTNYAYYGEVIDGKFENEKQFIIKGP